jgi:hypothetical protein
MYVQDPCKPCRGLANPRNGVLSMAFAIAMKRGLVAGNATQLVACSAIEHREMSTWTPQRPGGRGRYRADRSCARARLSTRGPFRVPFCPPCDGLFLHVLAHWRHSGVPPIQNNQDRSIAHIRSDRLHHTRGLMAPQDCTCTTASPGPGSPSVLVHLAGAVHVPTRVASRHRAAASADAADRLGVSSGGHRRVRLAAVVARRT